MKKATILVTILLVLGIFGIMNRKVCFETILFGMALLAYETKVVENRSLKLFLNATVKLK